MTGSFKGWFLNITPLKTFPKRSLNFVKVGFPDKMTGLWAFEGQMPYQKYQGPPIVVRLQSWIIAFFTFQTWILYYADNYFYLFISCMFLQTDLHFCRCHWLPSYSSMHFWKTSSKTSHIAICTIQFTDRLNPFVKIFSSSNKAL